jgi:Glycosyltransferase family 87
LPRAFIHSLWESFRRSPLLWLVVVISGVLFSIRGLGRIDPSGLADFAAPYAGAKLLVEGGNPYDAVQLSEALLTADAPSTEHTMAVYPPGSLAVMVIFAPFPANLARYLMIGAGLGLIGFGTLAWMRLLSFAPGRVIVGACMVVACAPLHTAMTVANPVILSAGALLAGAALVQCGLLRLGLFLIVLAMALKPQVGSAGLVWLILNAEIKRAVWVCVAVAAIHVTAAATLFTRLPSAWVSWMANLHAETTSGSISAEAYLGFQRIDPAGLWFGVTGLAMPPLATLSVAGGFIFLYWYRDPTKKNEEAHTSLLRLGSSGIALLLAGYHRSYDALLLVPLWLAIIGSNSKDYRRVYVWLCLLTSAWILPGAGFWRITPEYFGFARDYLDSSSWWTAGVLRLHGWILLLTAISIFCLKLPLKKTDDNRRISA